MKVHLNQKLKGVDTLPPGLHSERIDTFSHERLLHGQGYSGVAGLDEAGRGPLAGPVVAACVVLPRKCDFSPFIDSKKLSHKQRCSLADVLVRIGALTGVGIVSVATIDRINILQASLLAMKRAVDDLAWLHCLPDFLLIDGKFPIAMDIPQRTLIRGESQSASIAAASIVAKVTRDALMAELAALFPAYNFDRNKGYPTQEHRAAIERYGPASCHRLSFRGVKEFV